MEAHDGSVEMKDHTETSESSQGLATRPADNALTLPAKRLAGSTECMNCGTPLRGPFCHHCGQPDKNLVRFFPVLMRELMEDFLDLDSRFVRTIKPLLFLPGKLTRDYLDGKRFRYVPPLRLYLFSSIAFFFVAAVAAESNFVIKETEEGGVQVTRSTGADADAQAELDEAIAKTGPDVAQEVEQALEEAGREIKSELGGVENDDVISFDGEPWDRETNPVEIPWMPDWVNNWINDEIADSPRKRKEIANNPNLIKDKVFEVLPVVMFVLLPLVALLFKFWYLFAKKYYVEHLIFALHNHSFIFVVILLTIATKAFANWLEPTATESTEPWAVAVTTVLLTWIPVYLLVSLKRVYRQGWIMTTLKFCTIGSSYMILLIFTSAFVALLSFVLL
jgi:hypothetical protein